MVSKIETFNLNSVYTDYTYTIRIFIPEYIEKADQLPIYYILDGSSYFPFASQIINLQSSNAPKTKVSPAIVVSIEHGEDRRDRRFYDFTAPAKTYVYPERFQNRDVRKNGGAKKFTEFLMKELKPIVHQKFPSHGAEIIFGHSLGGYYALWLLFMNAAYFDRYIAFSPSIWWNQYELEKLALPFIKAKDFSPSPLFIAVGGKEGFMVEDSDKMYQLLQPSFQNNIAFYKAEDENHASVVPTAMSRAIRFISSF